MKRLGVAATASMRPRWMGVMAACVMLALPASAQAISNGSLDGAAHPNVGAVTVTGQAGQVLSCTGILISPTVLVTAAHCTGELQQLGFSQAAVSFDPSVGSGSTITCGLVDCYVSPAPKSLYVGTLHTDPLFNGSTTTSDSHDVGVVTFATRVKGVAPAALPQAGLVDSLGGSQTFTAVGYGWTGVATMGSNWTGFFDGARRNATSAFRSADQSNLRLNEDPNLGYGGACSHDSGGPAFVGTSNVVAGVVSNLVGDSCNTTSYYYRLDTDSARSFLANYVALP